MSIINIITYGFCHYLWVFAMGKSNFFVTINNFNFYHQIYNTKFYFNNHFKYFYLFNVLLKIYTNSF